jgi:hypothetical protein
MSRAVMCFEPRFVAFAEERRARRAVSLKLDMLVFRVLQTVIEPIYRAPIYAEVAAGFDARLLKLNMAAWFKRRFRQEAILVVHLLHREADETAIVHPGSAGAVAAHAGPLIERLADGRVVRVGVACGGAQAKRECASADGNVRVSLCAVIDGGEGGQQIAAHAIDAARWNALVDHVDDAADRVAAIGKHRRAAQHFDPLCVQAIGGDGVIGRSG